MKLRYRAPGKSDHNKASFSGKLLATALIIIGIAGLLGNSCTQADDSDRAIITEPYVPEIDLAVDITPFSTYSADKAIITTPEIPASELDQEDPTSTPFINDTQNLVNATPTYDFISPICSPLKNLSFTDLQAVISQPYNVTNPYSDFGHHGLDLGSYNFRGQYMYAWPVQAVMKGRVAGMIADRPPLGNAVILETPQGMLPPEVDETLEIAPGESIYHMYAHLLKTPEFRIGQEIDCGEVIGQLGKSQTVEAHLHLEMRIGESGRKIPGMAFYDTSASEEERQAYLWWRTSGDFMPFDPMIFLALLNAGAAVP